jgi:hypothetical protein
MINPGFLLRFKTCATPDGGIVDRTTRLSRDDPIKTADER